MLSYIFYLNLTSTKLYVLHAEFFTLKIYSMLTPIAFETIWAAKDDDKIVKLLT